MSENPVSVEETMLKQAARDWYVSPQADDQSHLDLLEAAYNYAHAVYGDLTDVGMAAEYKQVVEQRYKND